MRKTAKNWTKNIVILALSALCIIQTGRFWFGGVPSLDFRHILGLEQPAFFSPGSLYALTVPKRVLASEGGNFFIARYSRADETENFQSAMAAISEALAHGEYTVYSDPFKFRKAVTAVNDEVSYFEYVEFTHFDRVLTSEALVFDYGFGVPMGAFMKAVGLSSEEFAYDFVFDMIFLSPGTAGTRVFFVDSKSPVPAALGFTARESEVVYHGLESRHNLFFFASVPAGLEFGRLLFLPRAGEGGMNHLLIRPDDFIIPAAANIQNMMLNFFDNPSAVRDEVAIGRHIYTYAGGNTRAVYRTWLYIEYRSWNTRGLGSTECLAEALSTALEFMTARDVTLVNEIYLHSFEQEGAAFHLRFNYIFDDLPVILTEPLKYSLGLNSFIDVTVERGRVSHYKRFAIMIVERGAGEALHISYQDALRGELQFLDYSDITGIEIKYAVGLLNAADLNFSVSTAEESFIIFAGD